MEVFARTIAGISTKSESESVSVENSAKSDIGPFLREQLGRFGEEMEVDLRVAKCHEYGRYICVKILKGWGKKCRRPSGFVK